jgi:hypothetical protein
MHHVTEYQIKNEHICNYFSVPDPIDIIRKRQFNLLGKFARMDPTRLPRKFLTAWVSHPRCSGGQHYTLWNSYVETLQHILPNSYSRQRHHRFMAAPCAEPWTVEGTRDWMDKAPTSTHDLSVWSSPSLRRWHPRSSVPLVLTRHSSPVINERWTRVINLSMFFLLCYGLTTILRSRALHRVLFSVIQYARRSYMLSGLYRKVKTFRSDLLTYLYCSTKVRTRNWMKSLLGLVNLTVNTFLKSLMMASHPAGEVLCFLGCLGIGWLWLVAWPRDVGETRLFG